MGYNARLNPQSRTTASAPPAVVRDAYHRPLSEGDMVMLQNLPAPVLYQIAKITPVMNPSLPSNLMEVILYVRLPFHAARNMPAAQFIRVLTREEVRTPEQREAEEKQQQLGQQEAEEPNNAGLSSVPGQDPRFSKPYESES